MVIDNFFDDLYLHQLYDEITKIPVYGNNIANRNTWPYGYTGSHRLLGNMLFDRTSINDIVTLEPSAKDFLEIFSALEEKILNQKVYLRNIQLNLQTQGMDGTTHTDSFEKDDATILFMVNPIWNKEWGGEFQILDESENVIEEYDYKPGRILIFPSDAPHRGLSPKEKYIFRYSIVYRISPLKNYI